MAQLDYKKPDWRKIESALIELLREEGLVLEQVGGETSITIYSSTDEDDADNEHQINLGDFAKELERRL